jgi:predicted nucleic acid-binding protein
MILADTSVWVDHLRQGDADLARALEQGAIAIHPFVLGEIALGHLKNRRDVLDLLAALPPAPQAEHDEVLHAVEQHQLAGRGLGWIDVHLLAATLLAADARLWTRDKRLHAAATDLGVAWAPESH